MPSTIVEPPLPAFEALRSELEATTENGNDPLRPATATNGHARKAKQHEDRKPEYDPRFTDRVIAATGPGAHPRLAQIMPSLVRHLHDFAREVDLTVDEWAAGVELPKRSPGYLLRRLPPRPLLPLHAYA
ncbi:hypothetical protein DL769_002657 [Monosporascus sp. CRB-8-3]|nr:hypothetical protein DL769_002657 [Monosporascus sp. CRB-8-3]